MASCAAFDPLGAYVPTIVAFVDCHARALGEDGYNALGSASPIGLAISGFVSIYIAIIGYRMLLGDLPDLREIVLAAVKIGAVVAIATQWQAYQVLVYDVVVDEPQALASHILQPGGLGGEDAPQVSLRIQAISEVLDTIIHPELTRARPVQAAVAPGRDQTNSNQPQPLPRINGVLSVAELDSLVGAEKAILVSTLAGLLSTRIVAGVLLALGPLFIGFFLFDTTRGLFVGWARALAATIFASVGVLAALAIEISIVEPQVGTLLKALQDGFNVPTLVSEVAATSSLFAILIATTLLGAGIVAFGLRLPDALRQSAFKIGDRLRQVSDVPAAAGPSRLISGQPEDIGRSRAQKVADAVSALDRRDDARNAMFSARRVAIADSGEIRPQSSVGEPLVQGPNRTTNRYSARARQRDSIL